MTKKILLPVPDRDFDTTEVAVPWRLLTRAGFHVTFATEQGRQAPACDPRLLTGVLFGKLGADPEAKAFYTELQNSPEFRNPIAWSSIVSEHYDALVLPGGHAPGMRQYLANHVLLEKVSEFWSSNRPVAAICHGVLLLARARDAKTGKSLLQSRTTTCLPKYMEGMAYALTFWKLGNYYRTYPEYVEDEVRANLDDPRSQFKRGPLTIGPRGTATDDSAAFVVEDGNYLSARWPGDAYLLTRTLIKKLEADAH